MQEEVKDLEQDEQFADIRDSEEESGKIPTMIIVLGLCLGTMIFRDRGKRTENAESTIGNGKRIFKRKNTEMYF